MRTCSHATSKKEKGIVGETKIQLKEWVKPVRKRPYKLNPRYNKKVGKELDRMLDADIIFPV
jgi:hypothetical protein